MQRKTKKEPELFKLDDFVSQRKAVSTISNEKKIHIHIDNRESSSQIARELLTLGVDVRLSNLPVGDYVLSDRVAVERKSSNDMISSIIDRRLFDQLKALKEAYSVPLLLIEGIELFGIRRMHPEAIRGALASVVVDYGISTLWTMNQRESAQMLYTIAKREQTERETRVTIRGEKKPPSIREMQEFLVAGLPNVDSVLGKRLLEHFGSVEGVFAATKEGLMEVPGIGKKIAEKIRLVASHMYGKELSDSLESS
jgi:ERCC4-type nuclease